MSGNTRNVPLGTRDIMFREAELYRDIESRLTELYVNRGYSEIMTPGIEYYDVFEAGSTLRQEQMYKLTSPDGRLLVLRADNTTPIARVAATRFDSEVPVKLFYHQKVYRLSEGYKGRRSEIAQSGIEIIGASGIHSDLICMMTAIETLKTLCRDFKLEIGHVGYYNALISELDLDPEQADRLRILVEAKDANKISGYEKIKKIPFLFGGEEVFAEAEALAGDNAEAINSLTYLKKLYGALCDAGYKDNIMIDLGIVHSLDYYTGTVFKGHMSGAGEPILSGGRYDTLISKFSNDIPATGFGVNVSEVVDTLIREISGECSCAGSKDLVCFDTVSFEKAYKYAYSHSDTELSMLNSKQENFEYAEKNGYHRLVCFENGKCTTFLINGGEEE